MTFIKRIDPALRFYLVMCLIAMTPLVIYNLLTTPATSSINHRTEILAEYGELEMVDGLTYLYYYTEPIVDEEMEALQWLEKYYDVYVICLNAEFSSGYITTE